MSIAQNIDSIRERIARAAADCGRRAEDITLVAVTKTYPTDMMNEAIAHGITDIGENKPQEVRDKYGSVLPVRWHLIGHLQTNKVKYVIDRCAMIHSVDSVKLMDEIERLAALHDRHMDILLEVNIGGEDSKSGIPPRELDTLLTRAGALKYTHVKGLMTIAPLFEEPEPYFEKMQRLFEDTRARKYENAVMQELSMGMSGDFEAAIKYGATMVRVGTAIFGQRNYNI